MMFYSGTRISGKINPKIALLHRLRQYVPEERLIVLHLSLIQTHIDMVDYRLTVWGRCANKYLSLLQRFRIERQCESIILFVLPWVNKLFISINLYIIIISLTEVPG